MTDLIPVAELTPVPQLETNTIALGGTGNPMNMQAQALLNRTELINEKVDAAVLEIEASAESIGDLQTYNTDVVSPLVGRSGSENEYAWGNVKQNSADFATFGPNLAPVLAGFAKTGFDASGNHAAGTSGTMTTPIAIPAFSYFRLQLTITTTTPGAVQVKLGTISVFGDTPLGYYFSNAAILADGTEQDRVLSTTVYTFMAETSGSAQPDLTIVTDTLWAGNISVVDFRKVDPTRFSVAGAGTGNGPRNPVGLKNTGYNRNDVVLGDKYSLGMYFDDGQPLMGAHNVAIGSRTLASNVFGSENTAVGSYALQYNEGTNNCAFGYSALKLNSKGQENTALGYKCGVLNTSGFRNTYTGFWAFGQQTTGSENTGSGWYAGRNLLLGSRNTLLGSRSGQALIGGDDNTFIGALAGYAAGNGVVTFNGMVGIGGQATAFGDNAISIGLNAKSGLQATSSPGSVAIGANSSAQGSAPSVSIGNGSSATGARSVAVGDATKSLADQASTFGALAEANALGTTSIGAQSGRNNTGQNNTFIGRLAGNNGTNAFSNTTCVGSSSAVTAGNQVQLGDSATTTYVYGTVQNRSDARDKADVTDTSLGIGFINGLRAVQGRWDIREDYRELAEDGEVIELERDGSKKRKRLHQWFLAQEVAELCERMGVEFAGLQHHAVAGGEDVYSLGYDEFIPPAVRAIQQCWARLDEIDERLKKLEEK